MKESRIMGCGLATAKAVAKLNQGKTWEEGKIKNKNKKKN